ncbi:MAG TPA: hypothetical protein V6C76_04790 [Drouetiella sp.]
MSSRNQIEQVETNALNGRSLGLTENQLAREARAGLTGANEATTRENIRIYNQYAHSAHLPEVSFTDGPSALPSHNRHEAQGRPHQPVHNRTERHDEPHGRATVPADRDHRPLTPEEQKQQVAETVRDAEAAMRRFGRNFPDGSSTITEQQLQQAMRDPNLTPDLARGLRFLAENRGTIEHPEMHGRNSHEPYFYSRDIEKWQHDREQAIDATRR